MSEEKRTKIDKAEPKARSCARPDDPHRPESLPSPQLVDERPDQSYDFVPRISPMLGALMDPLQCEETLYDMLGVGRHATETEIEAAYRKSFSKKGATQARKVLKTPSLRARHDVTIYNEVALRRLSPCPLDDEGALHPVRREQTYGLWWEHFKKSFPDPGIAHCLGVFWYWWTLHEEARFLAILKHANKQGIAINGKIDKSMLMRRLCEAKGLRCTAPNPEACSHAECAWRADCTAKAPPLEVMWERVIAYWTMLEAMPMFWETYLRVTGEEGVAIGKDFVNRLNQKLLDLAKEYASILEHSNKEGDPDIEKIPETDKKTLALLRESGFTSARDVVRAGVRRLAAIEGLDGTKAQAIIERARSVLGDPDSIPEQYRILALKLENERATAKAVAKAAVRTHHGRVICGAIMLRQVGMTATVRSQVNMALAANPADQRLLALRDVLSPYYSIVLLLESKRLGEALEAIGRLPAEEQKLPEVRNMRVQALHLIACEEASLGQFDDALNAWADVLKCCESLDVAESIKREIAELSHARSQALRKHREDDAIRLLSAAHRLTADRKLGILLAEMLTQRGIDRFLNGKKKADDTPAGVASLFQRAATAAKTQNWDEAIARLREALALGQTSTPKPMEDRRAGVALCESGLTDLKAAAALGYKRGKEQCEAACDAMDGVRTGFHVVLHRILAVSLTNRAVGRVNAAVEQANQGLGAGPAVLTGPLRASEQDLLEAAELDTANDRARTNLNLCRDMLSKIGLSPGRLDSSRRPITLSKATPDVQHSGKPSTAPVQATQVDKKLAHPSSSSGVGKGKSGCLAMVALLLCSLSFSFLLCIAVAGLSGGTRVLPHFIGLGLPTIGPEDR